MSLKAVVLPVRSPVTDICGLCFQRSSRRLSCSHAFCLSCLTQMPTTSSFPCPTCRSPTHILPGGPEGLHHGFDWSVSPDSESNRRSPTSGRPCNGISSGSSSLSSLDTSSSSLLSNSRCCSGGSCNRVISCSKESSYGRGTSSTPQEDTPSIMERTCNFHAGEQLRFYCKRCSQPVCRDCKLSTHEGHFTIGLLEKSSQVKDLATMVTDLSHNLLEPHLRQQLHEAKQHQALVDGTRMKLQAKLRERADSLKAVVDIALTQATQQLEKDALKAETAISSAVNLMAHGLATYLSFMEHVQRIITEGCGADVVDLLPQLKHLFMVTGLEPGVDSFEILEDPPQQQPNGVFGCFLPNDCWMNVQLSASSTATECPVCFIKYNNRSLTCPKCSSKSKNPFFMNLQGLRGKKHHSRPQLQCQVCHQRYSDPSDFCPSCGVQLARDGLDRIRTLVPEFLGNISLKEQESSKRQNRSKEIFNTIKTISSFLHEEP